jgi:hypothetical protein
LTFNDGTAIASGLIDQTATEIGDRFGGVSQDTVRVIGQWTYLGIRYQDELIRLRIDTDDAAARTYLKAQKEVWKERFRQIDLWITVLKVEVI